MLPDVLCERYTQKQILYLYKLIINREVKEINREYRMVRATRAVNAPNQFIKLVEKSSGEKEETSGGKQTRERELAKVGLASSTYNKNYNPKLKVIKSEK